MARRELQVWYGLYGVAGMRGSNDLDFTSLRTVYYNDNNDQPAAGARVAFTLSTDGKGFFGDVSVGASATGGRYDRAAKLDYVAVGADASMKLGPFTLARRVRDAAHRRRHVRERLQVGDRRSLRREGGLVRRDRAPARKRLDLVYRYDELRRRACRSRAPPSRPDSLLVRYTAGLVLTPAQAVYVKLAWEYWTDEA